MSLRRITAVEVRVQTNEGWYLTVGSAKPKSLTSKPPTYPAHRLPEITIKL